MELRQWESNTEDSLEPVTTVLGLKWDKKTDDLFCKTPKPDPEMEVTKRAVLSVVSQVFDPIGYTCPAMIQPKMLLQDSWAVSMDWDEEWCQADKDKFLRWYVELEGLGRIRIPRRALDAKKSELQIHVFTDASKNAYAGVVFARVNGDDGVHVELLTAKARLTPLDKKKKKGITIPRLELMGCVIGARLLQTVKEGLNIIDVPVYCWNDSTTALAWIKRREDWGTFVGRRVKEIERLTSQSIWRHVPGYMNPSDLPSRGCSPKELLESRWWEGPEWLKDESQWPKGQDEVQVERKKISVVSAAAVAEIELKFSSYLANVRVAAWVRRFTENCRKEKGSRVKDQFLRTEEVRHGETYLLRQVQRRHYQEKPIVKNLSLNKEDGLYRIKTRLTNLEDTDDFRNPILLPKEDQLVQQLIEYVHKWSGHAGTQFVLGKLREKYWIVHGRKTVGAVIRKCVVCKRHTAKSVETDPAPLPSVRVNAQFAFQTTGVDLAGPLVMKGGKKTWIVLYTCAVYRGVFLDVVDSLSTDEFLDSLEKFTNIIGRPSTVYSDNGTNFVGAQNLMTMMDWPRLEEKLQVKQIRWQFNPPTAAWWGGWWERLVRSIKDLLKRMIGTARLTRKELEKCLASISQTINNRPLTTLTEDSEDLIPLTPAMFMRDLPVAGLPERELLAPEDLREAFRKIGNLKRALKERFRKEYLALLVQRQNEKNATPPEVGDVVLVGQDNKKRYAWPLGRVVEVFPGKDGKIRLAKVKTAHGLLLRPLQRLYPLEVKKPRTIEVPVEVVDAVNGDETPVEQIEDVPAAKKTRSGRKSKKPSRYGVWNN